MVCVHLLHARVDETELRVAMMIVPFLGFSISLEAVLLLMQEGTLVMDSG